MKQSQTTLRLTLLLVFMTNFLFAFLFFFRPDMIGAFYGIEGYSDIVHLHFAMAIGALLIVFAIGALLAFLSPIRNAGMVTLLIFMHLAIFVLDVVILAGKSPVSLYYLVMEIVYMLLICTLLIRFYPAEPNSIDVAQTAEALVDTFEDRLKEREKQERKLRKKIAKEQEEAKKEAERT